MTKPNAVDELPQDHAVWSLAYIGVPVGALLALGWLFNVWRDLARTTGEFPVVTDVITSQNVLVAMLISIAPLVAAMGVVELVARLLRRSQGGSVCPTAEDH